MVAPGICESQYETAYVTLLAPRILTLRLDYYKISASLLKQ